MIERIIDPLLNTPFLHNQKTHFELKSNIIDGIVAKQIEV